MFQKWSLLLNERICSNRSKFFHLRVDSYSEELQNRNDTVTSHEYDDWLNLRFMSFSSYFSHIKRMEDDYEGLCAMGRSEYVPIPLIIPNLEKADCYIGSFSNYCCKDTGKAYRLC